MYSDKVSFDKFYTKQSVSKMCIEYIDIPSYDFIIEPSAGNGSFFNNINHHNKIGLDLEPENDGIIKQNWFDYSINPSYSNVLVIGNPPFGKRNKLSKDFIKHSMSFNNVSTVAFILPNVYNKHTNQSIINNEYRIKDVISLPKNSFIVNGIDYDIPCSFYVFDKSVGIDLRFDPTLYKESIHWIYGTKNDYDFFVMGASANTIKDKPNENNRGYYIKVKSNFNKNHIQDKFIHGNWVGHSSCSGGVNWLSKPELVKLYNEQYQ